MRRPRPPGMTAADRLVASAQWRLALATLALLVGLVTIVGVTTAYLAQRALDDSVDRTLHTAAAAELERLESDGVSQAIPSPTVSRAAPTSESSAEPTDGAGDDQDEDDHVPAAADTFFLELDGAGRLLNNPEHVALDGLPDGAAAAAALATGSDLRTDEIGETNVRLLTLPVPEAGSGPRAVRLLQTGFVLTLHDTESETLLLSVLVVAIGGLVGAALITVLLTRRALVPVRSAFDRERRFVAAASHELRTPVALIRGSAEVLEREGAVRDDGRQLVRDIVDEADRLRGLVSELSELAVAQARPPDESARCDLGETAADVIRRAGPLAETAGVHLVIQADADLMVHGSRRRVSQILLILIDNAIRHSQAGASVSVSVAQRGSGAIATVADQGPGVPPDERDRIFEPFARLDSTSTGAGLGLAIARELVESMGGTIRVGDAPDGGAQFEVGLRLV